MRETVFIRPDRETAGAFEWLRLDAAGTPAGASARGAAEEAMLECEGRRVVLLAPVEVILLTSINVPARNRQRLLQALPFVLEDRLIQEIEELHFALGTRASDGSVAVAVIERLRLDGWLGHLRSAGIEPDLAAPDALTLPLEPGSWTVTGDGPMTVVRTAAQSGFAAEADNLPMLLEQALEEAGSARPSRIVVHGEVPALTPDFLTAMGVEAAGEPLEAGVLELMARNFNDREVIDLLQGDYNRREQFGRLYRPWLPVGITLAVVLALNLVMTAYDYFRLSRESARLQTDIENLYKSAFPEARRVVNPRVQMERGLETLKRGGTEAGGLLDILRTAGPLLGQTEGVTVQRLNYHENRVELGVTAADFQSLDALKQRLSERTGTEVDIQSASAADGKVEARLQLKARP